ncbi:MAG: M28 family peptidase [Gemmatimonadales bacterium]
MRIALAGILLATVVACAAGDPVPDKEFSGRQALDYVEMQLAFGPRIPGTEGHAAMALWLDSMARSRADTVVVQRWWHRTLRGDSIPQINIIARFNPGASARVLYMAHWDTRPRTDAQPDTSKTVPGANDGASGVAILLGVMDALQKKHPTVGVDLVFVDGEDYGYFRGGNEDVLIGSTYYSFNPVVPERPLFAVVWDMVGARDQQFTPENFSQIAAPEVVDIVWKTAERMGYGSTFVRGIGDGVTDDHTPLIARGFRAIDVIGVPHSYPYWHTEHDTFDKISEETLSIVGNVAVAVLRRAGASR